MKFLVLLLLMSAPLYGDKEVYRSGCSTGANITILVKEAAFIEVMLIDPSVDYRDRIEASSSISPSETKSVARNEKYSVKLKGYYVIKVTPIAATACM